MRLFKRSATCALVGASLYASLHVNDACAQQLPRLRAGMDYLEAHKLLVNSGWQMIGSNIMFCQGGKYDGVQKSACNAGFTNVNGCTANGYCSYLWKNAQGTILRTVSFGGRSSHDGSLINWGFE